MARYAALWSGFMLRSGFALVAVVAALLSTACARQASVAPASPRPTPRSVDLSHVVRQDLPLPPGEPPLRLERGPSGELRALSIGARTGTLLRVAAAPHAEPISVEQLAPQDLIVPAVMIDARDQAQDNPAYALSPAEVVAWEQAHGPIPPGSLVLLATGWDMRWGDPAAYLNLDQSGRPVVPGFSPAAAALLLDERQVAGLGLDAPVTALAPAAGHSLLLENLTSLEQLPPTGATLLIGALKLQAATSSPARVMALLP